MVIDLHTHAFPDDFGREVLANMSRVAGIPSYADGSVAGLRAMMARSGVDLSVVSRVTTNPARTGTVNRWLQSIRSPGIEVAFTLHPDDPNLAAELEFLRDSGVRGVKLHPDYQDFFVDEKRAFPLYGALEELGVWVLFHAGLDRGLPGATIHSRPKGLRRVLDEFPRLKVVAAHMGGEDIYGEAEEFLVGREVYLDTSFVLRKMEEETFRRFVGNHGAERIVFGTDSPWSDQAVESGFIATRPYLTDAEKEAILGGNAARLMGLTPD